MKVEKIIVHCSASDWGSAFEIDKWHREKSFKYIGYHFVIGNGRPKPREEIPMYNGSLEIGRPTNENGAHTLGWNSKSVGICLIGNSRFTKEQMDQLRSLCRFLMNKFNLKVEDVIGHYEVATDGRTCPNFDMNILRAQLRLPISY